MIFAAGLCYGKIMSVKKGLFWFQRFHLRLAFLVLRGLNDTDLGCSSENSFFLPSFKRMKPLKNTKQHAHSLIEILAPNVVVVE